MKRPGLPRTSRKSRGLTARNITYASTKRPHDRPRELIVDVPHGEIMDADYAAAMVAVRTGMPLAEVTIVTIAGGGERPRLPSTVIPLRPTGATIRPADARRSGQHVS
jgi:hypothetical protein